MNMLTKSDNDDNDVLRLPDCKLVGFSLALFTGKGASATQPGSLEQRFFGETGMADQGFGEILLANRSTARFWGQKMNKSCAKIIVLVSLGIVSSGLSGCAMNAISFPNISDVASGVKKVLSPEEQDQTIKEMALEQTVHRQTAITDIEKR